MVCVPLGREQPANAARVVALGTGIVVGPDASASELADAVTVILADPGFAQAARAAATRIHEARGDPLGEAQRLLHP